MIRRPAGHDEFLLITQDDHALFAGRIAEQIGGNGFAPPSPREEVVSAVAHHDGGWPLHDDEPTLNAEGLPLHVFEIGMPLATRIWSASADRALAAHEAYTGLLVSLHQLALSDVARKHNDGKPHERAATPRDVFELNKFQHRQVELQEQCRRTLGLRTDLPLQLGLAEPGVDPTEDLLRFNFRLLTLCDRLSLQLCCGKMLFPEIEDVHRQPGDEATSLETRFVDDTTLAVRPWPFAVDCVAAEVPARRVSARPFVSEGAFREAYRAAPVERVEFALRAG